MIRLKHRAQIQNHDWLGQMHSWTAGVLAGVGVCYRAAAGCVGATACRRGRRRSKSASDFTHDALEWHTRKQPESQ